MLPFGVTVSSASPATATITQEFTWVVVRLPVQEVDVPVLVLLPAPAWEDAAPVRTRTSSRMPWPSDVLLATETLIAVAPAARYVQ